MPNIKQKDLDNLLKIRDFWYEDAINPKVCNCEFFDLLFCKFDECQKITDFMQQFNEEKQYTILVDRYHNYWKTTKFFTDEQMERLNKGLPVEIDLEIEEK
jgi:hypothetical protein